MYPGDHFSLRIFMFPPPVPRVASGPAGQDALGHFCLLLPAEEPQSLSQVQVEEVAYEGQAQSALRVVLWVPLTKSTKRRKTKAPSRTVPGRSVVQRAATQGAQRSSMAVLSGSSSAIRAKEGPRHL